MKNKKLLFYLLLPLIAVCLVKVYFSYTDGFKIQKITPGFTIKPSWSQTTAITPEKRQELEPILAQEYRYLARGQQAYVFESADKKYVIKFLRMPKYRLPFWTFLSFSPRFLELKKRQKIASKKSYLELTSKSFAMAQADLWEQSGLIYCHLQSTVGLQYALTIRDPIGRMYILDLDPMYFIIQKRAEPLGKVLKELQAEANRKEIEQLIDSFIESVHVRAGKKIRNKNRNCMKNLGVLDGKVIEFDVGEFRERQALADPDFFQLEVSKSSRQLRDFIVKEMPEYLSYLDEKVQNHGR